MSSSMLLLLFVSVLGSAAAVTQPQPVPAQTRSTCESLTACAINEDVKNGLEMLQYRAFSFEGSNKTQESEDGIVDGAEEKEDEEDGVDHEDAKVSEEQEERAEDAGLAMVEENILEGEQHTTDVDEEEGQSSSKCPSCKWCKNKCGKDLTHIAQCPGFGGSKWNIFVKAEPYVKSTGRTLLYVNPSKLKNVGCTSWGSRGKDAYKFKLTGWATTEAPNAVNPRRKSFKDVNMVKTDICRCSGKKKCKGGRADDIFVKINMKNGRVSCHRPSSKEKKQLSDAPKPCRFNCKKKKSKKNKKKKSVKKSKPKPKWVKSQNNCKCHPRELKKFAPKAGKNTEAKCGAECEKKFGCKSFAVWKKGWCFLFSKKCQANCKGGKKTRGRGNNGKNTAYNMK
mmetsp:Transcript_156611/g.284949  ORF Transcript_156611/g.284949 Transcript_156611/m.284949 type:complete len:395 (-) Transcript_156611:115-1299(-)